MTDTSPQVMILITVAALAGVYAFILEWRRSTAFAQLLEWLRTERPENWNALSRSDRFLNIRAIEILRRGQLAEDEEFRARYQASKHGRQFVVPMTIVIISILLVVIGTQFFDWNW